MTRLGNGVYTLLADHTKTEKVWPALLKVKITAFRFSEMAVSVFVSFFGLI